MKRQVEPWQIIVAVIVVLIIVGGISALVLRDQTVAMENAPNFETRDQRAVEQMQANPPTNNPNQGGQ